MRDVIPRESRQQRAAVSGNGNGCLYVFCHLRYKLQTSRHRFAARLHEQMCHRLKRTHPPPTPRVKFGFAGDLWGGRFDLPRRANLSRGVRENGSDHETVAVCSARNSCWRCDGCISVSGEL